MIDNPKQSSRKDLSLKCESDFGEEEWIKQIEVTLRKSGENWEEACLVTSSETFILALLALFNRPRVCYCSSVIKQPNDLSFLFFITISVNV